MNPNPYQEDEYMWKGAKYTPEQKGPWVAKWIEIAMQNWWIVNTREPTWTGEPPISADDFVEYTDPWEMARKMCAGNWNTGTAFFYGDQCWINQSMGGAEMLVIKQDRAFESVTVMGVAGARESSDYKPVTLHRLVEMIESIGRCTVEQCVKWEYMPEGWYDLPETQMCFFCDELHLRSEMIEMGEGGRVVCRECAVANDLFRCASCGSWSGIYESASLGGELYCEDCAKHKAAELIMAHVRERYAWQSPPREWLEIAAGRMEDGRPWHLPGNVIMFTHDDKYLHIVSPYSVTTYDL